jgi:hypothetical protein
MDKKETTRLLSNLIQYNTVDINNMITTFPEIGKALMNVISAIDEEYGSGSIDKNLLTPDPTVKNLTFKVGDEFTTDVSRKLNYTYNYIIDKIDGDKVVIAWTDQKGKYLIDYLAKDVQELFDKNTWQLVDKNVPNKSYSFKVGDSFKYGSDIYKIEEIYEESNKDAISFIGTTGNIRLQNTMWASTLEDFIKDGTYTLLPAPTSSSTTTINYITSWRPDWKAMGLRPSPTRKASLGKVDDVGLGNDGIVYEIGEDKKGTKKWKKKGFNYFNPNVRALFTTYDKNLLIDQLNYENSQLDKTDVDYKENEKLIKLLLKEVQ